MKEVTSNSYDGLHTLTYRDTGKSHIYMLDGKRVPGATTVGATYPKGEGLIRWLIKQGIDEYDKRTKLEKAAAIGTIVHKYAECHMKGLEFNWDLVVNSTDSDVVVRCLDQYDRWSSLHSEDKLVSAEALVASPKLQVATQIDLVLQRGDDFIIRDYKTGKKIYISALHQTALGRQMAEEWLGIKCTKLEVVKFTKDPDAVPFESCIVEENAIIINGETLKYPGLLEELTRQEVRNIETYRHARGVEKILSDYYEAR